MFNSSINFCEQDYQVTNGIAEFWNTLTGLSLCISAIYQFKYFYSIKLLKTHLFLFLVGIGTMLFHGTMLYIYQLLDEIPMLLLIIQYIRFINKRLVNYKGYTKQNFKESIRYYYSIPFIIISYFIYPKLQVILFQGIFGIYICILVYKCSIIQDKIQENFKSKLLLNFYINDTGTIVTLNSLYLKVFSSFILGFVLWTIENNYCNNFQHLQLHAIWHILTSISCFYLNNIFFIYLAF